VIRAGAVLGRGLLLAMSGGQREQTGKKVLGAAGQDPRELLALGSARGANAAEPVRQQRLVDADLLGDEALAQTGFLDGVGERPVRDGSGRFGHDGRKGTTNHSQRQGFLTEDVWRVETSNHTLVSLSDAMARSGLGDREIARRTKDTGIRNSRGTIGYSHTQLVNAKNGYDGMRPRPELIEAVCRVIGFPVEQVAEYRLWQARRLFDEHAVGLEDALANLERYGLVSADGRKAAAREARQRAERAAEQRAGKPQRSRRTPRGRDVEGGHQ
jgi:hypothetical protein